MPKGKNISYPVDQIRRWIEVDGKTQKWIATELARTLDPRITHKLIYKVCRKHKIRCQKACPRPGDQHFCWKGGRIVNRSGYVEIYCPNHPNQRKHTKYILEHRLVMEKHLGRYLHPDEVVHHIDGNKLNNDISNLELFESNGKHLEKTLKGQCPKWTPDGLRRIREGMERRDFSKPRKPRPASAALTRKRMTIGLLFGYDVLVSSETLSRHLAEYGITLAEAFEMDDERLRSLCDRISHQKLERENPS